MKIKSLITQCKANPEIFFYYSDLSFSRRLGIYYFNNLDVNNPHLEEISKYELLFNDSEDIYKSIVSEKETPQVLIHDYFPTFTWCNANLFGAFTTGISNHINILEIKENKINIREKIGNFDFISLNLDWNNTLNNSNLLLSCDIFKKNDFLSNYNGVVSIYDLNSNQRVNKFRNLTNSEEKNNVFRYPKCSKWTDSHCFVSGWTFIDNLDVIYLNDIRVKDCSNKLSTTVKYSDFLSINSFDDHYLLSSNLKDFVGIYDLRFLRRKTNMHNSESQLISKIDFKEINIHSLDWFPFKKYNISILIEGNIFIFDINKNGNQVFKNEAKLVPKIDNKIQWSKNLSSYFEPLEVEDLINNTYCWYNNSSVLQKNKCSLIYLSGESAFYKRNIPIETNILNSFQRLPPFTYFPKKISKNSHDYFTNSLRILGYSWIPHRLASYFKEEKNIKNLNIEFVLSKWFKINFVEAQVLVSKCQDDHNFFNEVGVFNNSFFNYNELIRMIKSNSHIFNFLLNFPKKFSDWQELLKQLSFVIKNNAIKDNISTFYQENIFFPSIRDIINILKIQVNYEDNSYKIEFVNLNFDNTKKSIHNEAEKQNDQFNYLEIFSSPIREKLISICGISSVTKDKFILKEINDSSMIETYLLIFLWNCITLQYQNFLLQCEYISTLLDYHLDNKFKFIKTSFLNNLMLFLNSSGVIISNMYKSYDEFNKNLNNRDIYFHYTSVISTSDSLLDSEHYLVIWNSNIFFESVLQLSIRFILVVVKYISRTSENFSTFSSFLMEYLFIPCINMNTYIYIPFHLLLIIGLYYLPIVEVSILIEKMVEKMIQNGLLDGMLILGLQNIEKSNLFSKTFEKYEKLKQKKSVAFDLNSTEDNNSQKIDKTMLTESNLNKEHLLFKRSDNQETSTVKIFNQTVTSEKILKFVIQSYLNLSFGDIQTIALIGSCFFSHFTKDNLFYTELVKIFNKCIDLYRNFLRNNSILINSINNFKQTNKFKEGYRTINTKYDVTLRALYELNLLASGYFSSNNFDSEISTFLPSGNILYCYYCEQSLFQTTFEVTNIFANNVLKTEMATNSHITMGKDISELHLENKDNLQKYLSPQESEKGNSHIIQNKNNSSTTSYYSDNATNTEIYSNSIIINCPNKSCNKPLPRCVICLTEISLNINNKFSKQKMHLEEKKFPEFSQSIEKWYSWCLHCHHGGCFKHINEWFECFDECPVPECNCWCNVADPWTCF